VLLFVGNYSLFLSLMCVKLVAIPAVAYSASLFCWP
jgi:hypothetical protein